MSASPDRDASAPFWSRLSISRDISKPLYRQLREALEYEIAIGALDPQFRLPSSRELGLSRNTVNTAYLELQSEGFVEALPRQGLFVNREMVRRLSRPTQDRPRRPVDWQRHLNDRPDRGLPEIEKSPDWHNFPYPFIGGQVDPSSFPRLQWARALRESLEPPHLSYSLRDALDEDDPMLVEELCQHLLPLRGIDATPEQVLITSGVTHGLRLVAEAVISPGDLIGVEDPGYPDARHILSRAGGALRALDVDVQGLVPSDALSGVTLLQLTPSHHCPTNVTLSIARRQYLLGLAAEQDMLIVEDDYDSEFRYQGSPTPALKALPDSERVIYLGTFSKLLAPGLRLGFLVAEPELIVELRSYRRYNVRHIAGQNQRALALLMASGHYTGAVRRRRTSLAQRWATLGGALNEYLPWPTDPPPGGVGLWLTGPEELDFVDLAERGLERGLVLERGDIYFSDPAEHRNHLRLGFAAIDPKAIEPGVKILGGLIREAVG